MEKETKPLTEVNQLIDPLEQVRLSPLLNFIDENPFIEETDHVAA